MHSLSHIGQCLVDLMTLVLILLMSLGRNAFTACIYSHMRAQQVMSMIDGTTLVIVLMSLGGHASPIVSHIAAPGTEEAVQPGVCLLVEQAHEHPAVRLLLKAVQAPCLEAAVHAALLQLNRQRHTPLLQSSSISNNAHPSLKRICLPEIRNFVEELTVSLAMSQDYCHHFPCC